MMRVGREVSREDSKADVQVCTRWRGRAARARWGGEREGSESAHRSTSRGYCSRRRGTHVTASSHPQLGPTSGTAACCLNLAEGLTWALDGSLNAPTMAACSSVEICVGSDPVSSDPCSKLRWAPVTWRQSPTCTRRLRSERCARPAGRGGRKGHARRSRDWWPILRPPVRGWRPC